MMNGPIRSAFIYLMHLAWKSRLHIPFLLTVCFLVFDIRLQLEVNINMTRRRTHQQLGIEPNNIEDNGGNYPYQEVVGNDDDNDSEDDDEDDDYEVHIIERYNDHNTNESDDDFSDTDSSKCSPEFTSECLCPPNDANA